VVQDYGTKIGHVVLLEKVDADFYHMTNSQSGDSDFKIPINRVTSFQRHLVAHGTPVEEVNKFSKIKIETNVSDTDYFIYDIGYVLRLEKNTK